ncbi:hypothetical protein R1sor_015530 [Riccia sorocarpa]|uniref:ERCC4 domain-containing protein n=1 Tax=Riccia sorocarpa TaxID=122646 RepID=A0ABD3HEB2_9MARC
MAITLPARGGTLAITDSDEDYADKDFLLDWRGKGTGIGNAGLVQQTLGFKQVKPRSLDTLKLTSTGQEQSLLVPHEETNTEVKMNLSKVVVVSLSDDDDDDDVPTRSRGKITKPVATSVKHAGVVCLDSDSEPELYSSSDFRRRDSGKSVKQEEVVLRRSWEKVHCVEEDRIPNACAGPSKPPVSQAVEGHEASVARPFEARDDDSDRAAALSVIDFRNEIFTESVVLSKISPPALQKLPGSNLASVSVPPTKESTPNEGQEKINLRSSIVIQDLTSSSDDEDDKFGHSRGKSGNGKDDRTLLSSGLQMSEFESGKKRSWDKICSLSQEGSLIKDSKRVAGSFLDQTSPDGSPDPVKSTVREFSSAKGLTINSIDGLTGIDSGVIVHDLLASDDETGVKQIPPQREFTWSAEEPIWEEWPANLDVVNLDSQTRNLSGGWDEGTDVMDIDNAPSAFEAVRGAIDQQKSEKKKKKEQDQELKRQEKARKEEEKKLRKEENRKKREAERQQKEAAKAEAAERKKIEQECGKWKKGKFALENTTVYIDKRILESKTLGPPLLQQLASKEYKYQVVTNPVEKTVLWTMKMPSDDSKAILEMRESQEEPLVSSQIPLEDVEVKYLVVFLDAAEFSDMVAGNEVNGHIAKIRERHPGYTICYLVNNLTRYIHKKEQIQYRTGDKSWKRPNVEQVLAEFITHQVRVRSRLCVDENEMAEHIVGLTRSLAECPFKPKLTSLTINANGDHIGKGDPHREVIKKDPWKKALAAIPNMTGAAVIAITKVYPTMRSLLNAYLDPTKTVLEKEFLLQNIVKDVALGSASAAGRRVGPVCSRRVYRLLMAQNGNLRTEDAEDGEDYFKE